MSMYSIINDYLHRLASMPLNETNRLHRWFRFALDLTRHCAHELRQDNASQMAAALTYRTLFSLLPMLVLALVVLQSFRGLETYQEQFRRNIVNYAFPEELLEKELGASIDEPDEPDTEEVKQKLGESIEYWLNELGKVNFGGIGAVGLLVFIYGSTALLATIERSFNSIFAVAQGRPWYLRITFYYTIISLGPIVLVSGQVMQNKFFSLLAIESWTNWLVGPLVVISPVITAWIVLLAMFLLLPHTRVRLGPALVGSLISAILWVISKELFAIYVYRTVTTSLYGALGLVPLFLLWIYLAWLIVLFGLEVTYTMQAMKTKQFKHDISKSEELTGDPQWIIPLMTNIARRFAKGQKTDNQTIADELGLPARAVARFNVRLEQEGLLHRITGPGPSDAAYTLALPPDQIAITRLLELGQSIALGHTQRRDMQSWAYLDRLNKARLETAGNTTLATLLQNDGKK